MSKDRHNPGVDRRTLLKLGLVGAGSLVAGLSGYAALRLFLPSPPLLRDRFIYIEPEPHIVRNPVWVVEEGLVGQDARLSHFNPGRGAMTRWRTVVDRQTGESFAGTGFPVLLVRPESGILEFPPGYPQGEFALGDLIAVFNVCTHLGCPSTWKLRPPADYQEYFGFDTVYCPCHDAQFDPRRVQVYRHPPPPYGNGSEFLGIRAVAGPVFTGMPLLKLDADGDLLVGRPANPSWYRYLQFRDAELAPPEG